MTFPQVLDTSILSDDARDLYEKLHKRVIGQDRAIKQFVKSYTAITTGLNKENRPAGTFLFAGPTGVGKTELVRAAAEALLGKRDNFTRIDCAEFGREHEIAKLIGSPPGYLGHRETVPRLAQSKIDKWQNEKHKLNIILFDEIEKADYKLFEFLLGMLDSGKLTLGSGEETDFAKTIVILTTNLGSGEIKTMIEGSGIGFKGTPSERHDLDQKIYSKTKEVIEKHFSPEFVNRLDRLIVFRSLSEESLRQILDLELYDFESRMWRSPWRLYDKKLDDKEYEMPTPLVINIRTSDSAKDFLIAEGTSPIYGARELNRTIERYVAYPLGCLIGSRQAVSGDTIEIDYIKDSKELKFTKINHKPPRDAKKLFGGLLLGPA
jgi:ATP-dependent Clp protease ATP-binding subunit ClpB